ncbi:MAG: (2Fe-2S)-binding protein [Planctomycetales bacterium]|nr:(2Fe-2S)-binding protein [Planctomycetales bacterium]
MTKLNFTVNGQIRSTDTDAERPLLELLREEFGLLGTKFGCGEGECGACTVIIDGQATRSCITSASEAAGTNIETIESIADGEKLHPVQQAFIDHQAMQCGYCVPGHIMSVVAMQRAHAKLSREDIVNVLGQHICRCCNYKNILAAAEEVLNS